MRGDVILVGKFVQMVVTSYRLHRPVWTTDPKCAVINHILLEYSVLDCSYIQDYVYIEYVWVGELRL